MSPEPRAALGFRAGGRRDALAVGGLAVFLFFAATNLQAGWMYAIDAILVGVLVAGWASARWSVRGLDVRRTLASEVHESDPVAVSLELSTRRFPRFMVEVTDQVPGLTEFRSVVPIVWPGETVRLHYVASALRRGLHAGGSTIVSSSGVTGWFRARRTMTVPSALVVLPRIWRLRRLRLPGRRERSESPFTQSARTGLDLYGVRDYREGDSLRHVHWRSTARRGQLVVREYERETHEPTVLLLDARSHPRGVEAESDLFEDLVRAAASVAEVLTGSGQPVRVAGSVDGTPTEAGPTRRAALHWLAGVGEDGAVPPSRVYETLCKPGTPVVVFTTDPTSLSYFAARGIPHAGVIAREGDDLRTQLETL